MMGDSMNLDRRLLSEARTVRLHLALTVGVGLLGGVLGIGIGVGLGRMVALLPGLYGSMEVLFGPQLFVQALLVALLAGAVGGLYPAWRATRMRPVEALRYE